MQGPEFEVALNDGAGVFDAESGVAGGSITLDRFMVEELARSCHEFLVALDHPANAELWKGWSHLSGNGRRAAVERLRKGGVGAMKNDEAADHCETLVEAAKALGLADFYPEALALGATALRAHDALMEALVALSAGLTDGGGGRESRFRLARAFLAKRGVSTEGLYVYALMGAVAEAALKDAGVHS